MSILKTVRIGKVEDQDKWRREDMRNMTPNERLATLLEFQYRYLDWESNPKIERTGKFTKINFKDVE